MNDSVKKSICKTLSWRVIALTVTSIVVFIHTKSLTFAASIGIIDLMIKTVLYYLHERVWNDFESDNMKGG